MTADSRRNLELTCDNDACQPALPVGRRQEVGWAAALLASRYGRLVSRQTLVVDGANWQRRLTNPQWSARATTWAEGPSIRPPGGDAER